MLGFTRDDGGRRNAGFKGKAGDCAVRAIAIAMNRPYRSVYRELTELLTEMTGGLDRSVRDGVGLPVFHLYMLQQNWALTLTDGAYFTAEALPRGAVVAVLPRHFVAVRNHHVRDSWDSRHSKRTRSGAPRMLGYYQYAL